MRDFKYVRLLQEHVSRVFEYKPILETRGINPTFDVIIDNIIRRLKKNSNVFRFNTVYKMNATCTEEIFLSDLLFEIEFVQKENRFDVSGYMNSDKAHIVKRNKEQKLSGIYISLKQNNPPYKKPICNFKSIENVLWHELMHCYRLYQIFVKSNDFYPYSLQKTDKQYNRAVNLLQNQNNTNYSNYARFIGNCFYLMNQDEISARCSSVYGFVKSNKEINVNNFKKYLNELDIKKTYNKIFELYELLIDVRQKDKNDKKRLCVVDILRKIFANAEDSDSKVLSKTINNVKYWLSYINAKMYAALEYSLYHLGRNGLTEIKQPFYEEFPFIDIEMLKWNE